MASPASGPTNIGVAPNVGGLLCYVPCCIGFIFSIVVVIVEKQSRFVRFHAFQSLLLNGAVIVVWVGSMALRAALYFAGLGMVTLLVTVAMWAVLVAGLVVLIMMMIKANNGEQFALPVIGELAGKWV